MEPLSLATTEPRSGRTILGLALAVHAQRGGLPVRYSLDPASPASDVSLAREALGEGADAEAAIIEASAGDGAAAGGSVALVVWHRDDMAAEDVVAAAAPFGNRLAGVVFNNVPKLRLHTVQTDLVPTAADAGVRALGVIPQDRVLSSPTAGEIVEFLGGEVIAFGDRLEEPAENVMLGALALDGGIHYYGGTPRKVVITRFDRPDLQMPALETGCQALILTNGGQPIPYVWNRVQELEVPVALVQSGTIATAQKLSGGFLAERGRPTRRKVERMAELAEEAAPELLELVRRQ